MMKKATAIFFVIFFGLSMLATAQDEGPKRRLSPKVFFGGTFGLQAGTVTYIDISPMAGYFIKPRLTAGVGATYKYYSDSRYSPKFTTSIYGGSVFTQFYAFENIFLHAEVEPLSMEVYNPVDYTSQREWITGILVGAGYMQRMGERSGVYIMGLWNLNQTSKSPYVNPIIRVGFQF